MKIASVDIGTNAVKSKIFETTPTSVSYTHLTLPTTPYV